MLKPPNEDELMGDAFMNINPDDPEQMRMFEEIFNVEDHSNQAVNIEQTNTRNRLTGLFEQAESGSINKTSVPPSFDMNAPSLDANTPSAEVPNGPAPDIPMTE